MNETLTPAAPAPTTPAERLLAAEQYVATTTAGVETAKAEVVRCTEVVSTCKTATLAARAATTKAEEDPAVKAQRVHDVGTCTAADTAAKVALTAARKAVKDAKEAVTEAKLYVRNVKDELKVAAATPKVARLQQNGQTHPTPGTLSAKIWEMADKASAAKGNPAALVEIMSDLVAAGVKESSARAGYAHWRKFHGVTGRVLSTDQVTTLAATEAAKEVAAKAKADAKDAKDAADAAKAKAAAAPVTPAPATAPNAA
jgi:hypothetical protein